MTKKDILSSYKSKRDLTTSNEPEARVRKSSKEPIFVIQEHQGRALHYDFRIEADGVLKSWAVPKGPSTDPSVKRLAVPTEDHPLDYATFEGVIPKGHYGAGPVIVWDKGTYRNLKRQSIDQCIEDGEVTIWLNGKKLKGGYALIRTNWQHRKESWLLVKMRDQDAQAELDIIKNSPESVLSHKTLEEIHDEYNGTEDT